MEHKEASVTMTLGEHCVHSARYSKDLTYWRCVLNTAVIPEIVLARLIFSGLSDPRCAQKISA